MGLYIFFRDGILSPVVSSFQILADTSAQDAQTLFKKPGIGDYSLLNSSLVVSFVILQPILGK